MFQRFQRFLLRRKIERDILRQIKAFKKNDRSWSICGKCGGKDIKRTHCADWGHWHLECAVCKDSWLLLDKDAETSRAQDAFDVFLDGTPPKPPALRQMIVNFTIQPAPPLRLIVIQEKTRTTLQVFSGDRLVSTNVMNEGDLS